MELDHPKTTTVSIDEALQKLVEGNSRFIAGQAHFPTVCKETLADLAKAQHPYCTLVGCADSRVPPELIFDANFGELFIVRVAGNVISPEVMGSLQYAGAHLHTPLFVVLGHEGCGAVGAALESMLHDVKHRSRIQILVDNILPGLRAIDTASLTGDDLLTQAVEANVRWSMQQLKDSPEGKAALEEGRAKLVGAVYEIRTGRVRFLD